MAAIHGETQVHLPYRSAMFNSRVFGWMRLHAWIEHLNGSMFLRSCGWNEGISVGLQEKKRGVYCTALRRYKTTAMIIHGTYADSVSSKKKIREEVKSCAIYPFELTS